MRYDILVKTLQFSLFEDIVKRYLRELRAAGDYERSDALRAELVNVGFSVEQKGDTVSLHYTYRCPMADKILEMEKHRG